MPADAWATAKKTPVVLKGIYLESEGNQELIFNNITSGYKFWLQFRRKASCKK